MVDQRPYIQIRDGVFGYQQAHPLIAEVSLSFYPGELVGIVGLNGCGKSTFLRTLGGLLPLLGGEVLIKERSIRRYTVHEISRLVSIVLTEKVGGFNLRTYDFVSMGQMPYTDAFHRLRDEHRAVIAEALSRMKITALAERELSALSDGMFQKAAIAKSLAQQTPLLFLDEPTAFLDYASKHELFVLLSRLCGEEKKCVLVSSHDLDVLLKYCSKILVVAEGRCVLMPVAEAADSPAFRELTGGFSV